VLAKVPHYEVVDCSAGNELLSFVHQSFSKSLSILDDLLRVSFEFWSHDLLKLDCEGSNRHVVGTSLEHREHCKINGFFVLLLRENNARSWTSQTFVSCGGNNIAVLKWVGHQLAGNQSTDMGHVAHQIGSTRISDLSKSLIVKVSRVSTGSTNKHLWFKFCCSSSEGIIVDQSGLLIGIVRFGLEVVTGAGTLFSFGLMAVSQMSTMGQSQSHDPITWLKKSCINSKICWRSRKRLNVDSPFLLV